MNNIYTYIKYNIYKVYNNAIDPVFYHTNPTLAARGTHNRHLGIGARRV